MKKAVVIINPTSGGETALAYKDKIEKKLIESFDEVEVRVTEKGGDATEFAGEAAEAKCDSVFAFGGDGTVNEVIAGLAERDYIPKLGIFPGGTGNLLSRLMGINQDIDKAIEEFDPESSEKVDIGKCNDKYFGYILSVGATSDAIHNVGIEEKTKFGMLAYAASAMKTLVENNTFHVSIKTDGGDYEGETSQIVLLLSNWLGEKKLFEGDRDGYGNLLILKDDSFASKLSIIPDLLKEQVVENDKIKYIRAKELEIKSDQSLETDLDGDAGDKLPVKVKILPQHIEMYSKFTEDLVK